MPSASYSPLTGEPRRRHSLGRTPPLAGAFGKFAPRAVSRPRWVGWATRAVAGGDGRKGRKSPPVALGVFGGAILCRTPFSPAYPRNLPNLGGWAAPFLFRLEPRTIRTFALGGGRAGWKFRFPAGKG